MPNDMTRDIRLRAERYGGQVGGTGFFVAGELCRRGLVAVVTLGICL